MKLPKGKIGETISGGIDSLKNKIDEFNSDSFTGYLLILKQADEGDIQGQIVYKEGSPVLAEYLSPNRNITGPDSVVSIIETSINEESKIEVHTSIDVDLMIKFFSKAKISSDDLDIDKKLEELKELERKEKEKAEQLKKELEIRKNLEEQLKTWKMDGYVVTRLEKIFKEDIEKVESAFEEFADGVKKLSEFDERLNKIEDEEFKSQVEKIELKLNDPDLIPEIENEISNLEQMMAEQNEKRDELKKIVNEWKEDGYNVTHLIESIDKDVTKAWDDITSAMDSIQKLKEYEDMIKKIKAKGFDGRIEALLSNVKDIDALEDVTRDYKKLEELIKEDDEKKEKLRPIIEEWESSGYKVDSLKDIFDEPFDTVEEKFIEYEKRIKQIKELKDRLEDINKVEFEEEINSISERLTDLDAMDEITEAISELEKKQDEVIDKKKGLQRLLENLSDQGYDVSELEQVMNEKLATIMKKFETFENKKKQLDEIGKELDEMNLKDFPNEAEQIRTKLKDINAIDEISEMLSGLKEKMAAIEEEKNEIKAKVQGIKEEGYIVTKIEEKFEESISTLKDEFIQFLDEIQILKDLKEKMEGLLVIGHDDEFNSLKDRLSDPGNLPGLEQETNNFLDIINSENERRQEIKTKFDAWLEEGFELESIEDLLEKDFQELEQLFTVTEGSITKLKTVSEQIESLDLKWHEEEANRIKEQLKNPNATVEIESQMAGLLDNLEKEQQQKKELKDQLEHWREEGYVVTAMDNVMDQSLDKINEKAVELHESINKLKELENRLNSLDTKWFMKEAEEVQGILKEPEKVEDIENLLQDLENKILENQKKREELIAKFNSWKDQGFNVEPLEGVLENSLSDMENAFEAFEKDLNQLLELQKKMGIKVPGPGAKKEEKEDLEKVEEEIPKSEIKPEIEPLEEPSIEGEKEKKKPKGIGAEEPGPEERFAKSTLELILDYTFESFVVGASNRFTHAAALAVAETPAEAYNPLFIYGGVGLGKTHLLNAIGNHIISQHKKMNIAYTTSEKFTNELINSIRYDKIEDFRNIYRTADVLIIDDIQFLAGKESTQEEFFHTFNHLYNAHKQIVISSDRPPRDIPQLEERLKSRFEGGLITDIQPPSLETKIIILRREAKKEKIEVPDEVMHLIASKVKSNIRELRGALTKIRAYSKLISQDITEDLAKEVLKDFIGVRGPARAAATSTTTSEETDAKKEEDKPISVSDGLSSIEKRLSSLKKKLSPILRKDKAPEPEKEKVPEVPNNKSVNGENVEVSNEASTTEPTPEEVSVESDTNEAQEPPDGPEPGTDKSIEAKSEIELDEEVEEVDEIEFAKCGNCGELIPGNAGECPNCGVSFANETYECPVCRATVSSDASKCDNCGAEFEFVEEELKEEKKKKKKKKKK